MCVDIITCIWIKITYNHMTKWVWLSGHYICLIYVVLVCMSVLPNSIIIWCWCWKSPTDIEEKASSQPLLSPSQDDVRIQHQAHKNAECHRWFASTSELQIQSININQCIYVYCIMYIYIYILYVYIIYYVYYMHILCIICIYIYILYKYYV